MYKPCNIREMVTPAIHKKTVEVVINGRLTKQYNAVGNLRGKFKQKGSTETTANGVTVVITTTTFTTWYKENIKSNDVLTIGGIDYQIIGKPENVENRGRYLVVMLEEFSGGA